MPWISAKGLVPSSRWVLVSILCAGLVFVPGSAAATSPCESETVIPDGLGYLRSTCEILWEFFSGLDDPGFLDDPDNPEAWGSGTPFLDWQGLGFHGGRLAVLALGNTGIRGPLSPILSELDDLTSLELDRNDLTGPVPAEFGELTRLQKLILFDNDLTGPIPPQLGELPALRFLNLGHNDLTGQIPEPLAESGALTFLDLSANHLAGPIPEAIGGLEYLTDLNLHTNRLTGTIPVELGRLMQLRVLELGGNSLEGGIPSELGSLSDLVHLSLHTNRLTGTIPVELGRLMQLRVLELGGNSLEGGIPSELGSLSDLVHLSLHTNRVAGPIPPELGRLHKLKILSLRNNQLSGPLPPELGRLSNLEYLDLGGNRLEGGLPVEFGMLTNLTYLSLHSNELTGPIPAELGALSKLRTLWLADNELTGPVPPELAHLVELPSTGTVVASDIVDDHADTIGEATPVTTGVAVRGVVDYPDDKDVFVFDAEEGNLYQIDVALGTLGDSVATVYDAHETELAFNDDYGGSLASRVFWEAPSSGRYYIAVASWGDETGSYTLTVVASDIVDDHADTIGEATPVTTGVAVRGVVDYPDDKDVFVFDAEEGNLYQIDVALGTLGDSVATVYDAHETELAFNDDYGGSLASRVFWEAPSSGRYYIAVASWGDETGSYTLTVVASDIVDDHADTIGEATPVTTGVAVRGVVDYPDDKDVFVFDAEEGNLYQIDVALGTLGDSVATVYDAHETELAFNDDYGGSLASRVFWEAPSSGRYYIAVASWGDETGSYTLTVVASDIVDDHADTIGEATPVTTGVAVRGVVDYPDDKDVFVFDAEEGNLYQIDVALGTLGDSVATVYDAHETELAFNDDYGGSLASRVFWEAPSSGRYYIAVASWGDETGSYTLTVVASDIVDDHADTIGEATPVTTGVAVRGVVDYPTYPLTLLGYFSDSSLGGNATCRTQRISAEATPVAFSF